jgi:hypothetical protein
MCNKRFASLILACFVSASFYLPVVLAQDIVIEDIEVENLEVASGKPYVVGEEGLEVGFSLFYIDRAYTVASMSEEFEGATYISTAMEDGGSRDAEFITFEVEVPVVVWVGTDRRGEAEKGGTQVPVVVWVGTDRRGEAEKGGTPPAWLSADEGWEEQPDMILQTIEGDTDFYFLRSKEFAAGEIALGGNNDDISVGQDPMYVVFLTRGSLTAVEATDKLSTTWAGLKSK